MIKFIFGLILIGIALETSFIEAIPTSGELTRFLENELENFSPQEFLLVQEDPENAEPHRGSGRCDQCS